MKAFVRRILSGLLVLAGGSQAGCNPFRPCLSIGAPHEVQSAGGEAASRESPDASAPAPQVPVHPCLSPPAPMHPCLSMRPPSPLPPGLPDASSDARQPADRQEVLATLADRLPDDVKTRLGLSDGQTPKKA